MFLLSACVSEEAIIFKTHAKYHVLWSVSQTYNFFQDIYFIHISLSISWRLVVWWIKKKQNNIAVVLLKILHFVN